LLEAKLERVRKIFTDLPDSKKDARYTSLLGRWNALRSRAARAVGDDVKIRLASEVHAARDRRSAPREPPATRAKSSRRSKRPKFSRR